jgi:hypothetical protein
MTKRLLLSFLLSLLLFPGLAQYSNYIWEVGVKTGGSNYLGEIGGTYEPKPFIADMKISKTRPGLGVYGRRKITNAFWVNAGLQYSIIAGADSLSLEPSRFTRNLSFRNQITELYARGEFSFLNVKDLGRTGKYLFAVRSYAYLGISAFHHSPQGRIDGVWHNLRPLQTEGRSYTMISGAVPFGIGASLTLLRVHKISAEATVNYTFTDYLDDIGGYYIPSYLHTDDLARRLADRSGEVAADNPANLGVIYYSVGTESNPGDPTRRGSLKTNDSFVTFFVSYGYMIGGQTSFHTKKYDFVSAKPMKVKSRAKF